MSSLCSPCFRCDPRFHLSNNWQMSCLIAQPEQAACRPRSPVCEGISRASSAVTDASARGACDRSPPRCAAGAQPPGFPTQGLGDLRVLTEVTCVCSVPSTWVGLPAGWCAWSVGLLFAVLPAGVFKYVVVASWSEVLWEQIIPRQSITLEPAFPLLRAGCF